MGGTGFKPACIPTPTPLTQTQMDRELVFGDARAPDSALGILAECILGNVRPTGNRGLPLSPSRRWAGSGEREGCVREQGPSVQGAEPEGAYVHTRVASMRGRQLASKTWGLSVQGKRLGARM